MQYTVSTLLFPGSPHATCDVQFSLSASKWRAVKASPEWTALVDLIDENPSIKSKSASQTPVKNVFESLGEAIAAYIDELQSKPPQNLKLVKTCDLVRELQTREGVETSTIGPTGKLTIDVEGPAVVLVVVD